MDKPRLAVRRVPGVRSWQVRLMRRGSTPLVVGAFHTHPEALAYADGYPRVVSTMFADPERSSR